MTAHSIEDPSLEERLTELEVRLAFMDDAVTSLNAAVATQDRTMHRVASEMAGLRSDLQALRLTLSSDTRNEPPPPHY
ncbi:MAG: SlyX family protein [Dokdonella sp.]